MPSIYYLGYTQMSYNNKTSNNLLIASSNVSSSQLNLLEKWIADDCFEQYESPEYILSSSRNRPHNRLYEFTLPAVGYRVVMKVAHIHKQYSWIRRLRALLRYYCQRDTNYKAFRSCRYAYQWGLAAPKPLAYWRRRKSFTQTKSYFLYQYVENSRPFAEVSEKLKKEDGDKWQQQKDLLIRKVVDAVKCLHDSGVRHGDMVAHNILISIPDTGLSQAKVCFIDHDRSTLSRLRKIIFLKRFFDLRDLRKLYIDNASPYDLLGIYLGDDYHTLWRIVLAFWRLGTR